MLPKRRHDTVNNINWIIIKVHSIVNSGINLNSLPADVKLFDHKRLPDTSTVLKNRPSWQPVPPKCTLYYLFISPLRFVPVVLQPKSRPNHNIFEVSKSHTIIETHRVWLLLNSDKPITQTVTYTTQEMNVHACTGIQTCDPSNQVAADLLLRSHGQCDWLPYELNK